MHAYDGMQLSNKEDWLVSFFYFSVSCNAISHYVMSIHLALVYRYMVSTKKLIALGTRYQWQSTRPFDYVRL